MTDLPYKRKLIEVALPLEAINKASAREKSIRHGHPSTLHLWWARRPLAACRAVLFASLVDDPSSNPDEFPTPEAQEAERTRLFGVIERLVQWESTTDEAVLEEARAEIRRSTGGNPPPVLDPFCGGGSIPLEAQRLGLTAYASDLNPVAVLITKALVEIPPRFADRPPVHPDARRGVGSSGQWRGAAGLAADVRAYGAWMRDEAEKRIGHLYPKVKLPREQGGGEATVIAWLWARTVTCPNPACRARMPLVRSFALSTKKGKEAWVEPIVDREARTVRFEARTGADGPPGGTVGRQGGRCILCESPVPLNHIRAEGKAKRMDAQLLAIVADGQRGRHYLEPTEQHEVIARSAEPTWAPEEELPHNPRDFKTPGYGMTRFRDLFTPRQLVALTTFSDLVAEARELVRRDAISIGLRNDDIHLNDGGTGNAAYADAVTTYLAFAVDKGADYWSTICSWHSGRDLVRNTFARQAIPMTWDFAEANPFSGLAGSAGGAIEWVGRALESAPAGHGSARLQDAVARIGVPASQVVSTDPPYYDNIGYADLSDFFYVWLRRSLAEVYPDLFTTVLTPKVAELVATPYRFDGDKRKAEQHFESGLASAFAAIHSAADPAVPVTIYYAFKQAESSGDDGGIASTGWETMLTGLLASGFAVLGTWPMRTELANKITAGTNILASSIVLVCRPRPADAPLATRREFAQALSVELPHALTRLQDVNIAPVDMAQAAIGPGIAVFSRYSGVLEASGDRMSVRKALELINAELDAFLTSEHGDLDSDTRWCHTWYGSHGFAEAPYGTAETLATARNVSVEGLRQAGVLWSRGGKVRLLRPDELDPSWDPIEDDRLTVWECTHQLVRELHDANGGVKGAARLVTRMGEGRATEAKDLAYGLFRIAEDNRWTAEAGAYNDLVTDWPAIMDHARELAATGQQASLGI